MFNYRGVISLVSKATMARYGPVSNRAGGRMGGLGGGGLGARRLSGEACAVRPMLVVYLRRSGEREGSG